MELKKSLKKEEDSMQHYRQLKSKIHGNKHSKNIKGMCRI